jgi:hypothetical protein
MSGKPYTEEFKISAVKQRKKRSASSAFQTQAQHLRGREVVNGCGRVCLADLALALCGFKYGAVKGKRSDPCRFSDFSTHPRPEYGGSTAAASMYRITIATWHQHGGRMGLTEFSRHAARGSGLPFSIG